MESLKSLEFGYFLMISYKTQEILKQSCNDLFFLAEMIIGCLIFRSDIYNREVNYPIQSMAGTKGDGGNSSWVIWSCQNYRNQSMPSPFVPAILRIG